MDKSYIDKLALINVRDRKILMALSKGKDTWYTPGGKREEGETDLDALKREIKEELGVDLLDASLEYYGAFEAQAHGKSEGVMVRNTFYTGTYSGQITPLSEIDKVDYFSYSQKHLCSYVNQLLLDDLKKKDLID